MNVLVLVNLEKDKNYQITKELTRYLNEKYCNVYFEEEVYKEINDSKKHTKESNIDFAIILGGDGTILNFAHKYYEFNFPYFGINLGRVGCLTEGTIYNYKEKINAILNNNYYIEERNTIECKVMNGDVVKSQGYAFNEVSLQRAKFYKMMLISMLVNGSNLTSFYSDGVVVATPTGSSAFSLSCGGPLLLPTARNFVITPISPQLRTITSLVVNDTDIISLDLSKEKERGRDEDDKAAIVIDGYELIEVSSDDKIVINKSEKKLRIIKVEKEASLFEPTFKVALSSQNIK